MDIASRPAGLSSSSLPFLSFCVAFLLLLPAMTVRAEPFRIGIMQAQQGAAENFAVLEKYLRQHGIDVQFIDAPDYPAAARMFAQGELDGMFSGSGVAGTLLIKDLAYPLVRPVSREGYSTYWAVIIGARGAPRFNHDGRYFRGKRVTYCALASSGEFYFRSLPDAAKVASAMILAPSHDAAIHNVAAGKADFAIVKNWVWEHQRASYPQLVQVGNDPDQNPDETLIIAKQADRKTAENVARILLALKDEKSPQAAAVREQLQISGYIVTTALDFRHTLQMLRAAGVGPDFDFKF